LILSPDAAHIFAKQVLGLFGVAAGYPSRELQVRLNSSLPLLRSSRRATVQKNPVAQPIGCVGTQPNTREILLYSNLSSLSPHYTEHKNMANKFAHWLQSNGLEFEDQVVLCLEGSAVLRCPSDRLQVRRMLCFGAGLFKWSTSCAIHASPRLD
jgi:hypothetical protein